MSVGTAELLKRCRFPEPGTAVTCAVSGGADSLALLALAVAAGCEVTAVHVDHGLREGSDAEADVVLSAALRFGAEFRSEQVEVALGPNLEARAREARYGVLPPDVLTGHTADDQAETTLLALLWGSAWHGMAGMADDGRRPLLQLRRAETVALCEQLDLQPVADPMNDDRAFRRVRVRNEVLPLLNEIADRDMVPLLVRQAGVFAESAALLDDLAAELDATDAKAVAAAPRPLARLAIRAWLQRELGGPPPGLAEVDRVLDVAANRAVGTQLEGGVAVRRTDQRLRLER